LACDRTGPSKPHPRENRWTACSPTREDKSPSLSIRELDDGRLLLHDFGGASVDEVVAAVGLDLSDLFPQRLNAPSMPGTRRPWNAVDLIDLAAFEAGVIVVVTADILAGKADPDRDRLLIAAGRLADIAEVVHGRR
jgi:hypothetical protein